MMIRGNVDLSFLTDSMLESTVFVEKNHVDHANGLWKELGITAPNFPVNSAVVHQSFNDQCPSWAHTIKDMFPWLQYRLVTINKLEPGSLIPPHRDMFYRLRELTDGVDVSGMVLVRVNVLLQDKKYGHFLDIDNVALSDYRKGDYVYIQQGVIHSVVNAGFENRYTLQVTGLADPKLLT